MGIVLAPILEGKVDAWKQFTKDFESSGELADFNQRHGLTRHRAWLAETPAGTAVIALHEGPGSDEFMMKLATSDHQGDAKFREFLKDVHGLDFSQPLPGPLPELMLDSGG